MKDEILKTSFKFYIKKMEWQNCDDIMDMCGVTDIYYIIYTDDGFTHRQYSKYVIGPGIIVDDNTCMDSDIVVLTSSSKYYKISYNGKYFVLDNEGED